MILVRAAALALLAGPVFADPADVRARELLDQVPSFSRAAKPVQYCAGFLSVVDPDDAALRARLVAEAADFRQRGASMDGEQATDAVAEAVADRWLAAPVTAQNRIDMGVMLRFCLRQSADPELRASAEHLRIRWPALAQT